MKNPLQFLSYIGTQEEQHLQQLVHFVEQAPLSIDYWKVLKALYKYYEVHPHTDLLIALIHKFDEARIEKIQGRYPSRRALRYMKRRARRFLKNLTDDALYLTITQQLLLKQKGKKALDANNQWILFDIILGNSTRVVHKSHGYGAVLFEGMHYQLHRKEARKPQVWENQLPFVRSLLEDIYPWQVQAFAVKTLLQQEQAIPTLAPVVLENCFEAPSLWLHWIAKQQTLQRLATGETFSHKCWAGVVRHSNATERARLDEQHIIQQSRPWQQEFTTLLLTYVTRQLGERKHFQQKEKKALLLVARSLSTFVSEEAIFKMSPLLFNASHPQLTNLALAGAAKADMKSLGRWVESAKDTDPATLQQLLAICENTLKNKRLNYDSLLPFVRQPRFDIVDFGWKIANRSLRNDYYLNYLWRSVLHIYKRDFKAEDEEFKPLLYSVTSTEGVKAFIKNYQKNNYQLDNIPVNTLSLVIQYGHQDIVKFLTKYLAENFSKDPLTILPRLMALPEQERNRILRNKIAKFKNSRLFEYRWGLHRLFAIPEDATWVWQALFQIIENSMFDIHAARNVLEQVFAEKEPPTPMIDYVLKAPSPVKDHLLQALRELFVQQPRIAAQVNDELRTILFKALSLKDLLQLIVTTADNEWEQFKAPVLERLTHLEAQGSFWKSVFEQMMGEAQSEQLYRRLLEDEAFLALFLAQNDPEILQINHPIFEDILYEWLLKHQNLFKEDAGLFYQLCTHKLPQLRTWALQQIDKWDIDLPFALRLMESGLPESTTIAQNYFTQIEKSTIKEFEAILALCDSPQKPVRDFGLSYLKARKDQLLMQEEEIWVYLSEHADSTIQEAVAAALLDKAADQPFVERFDQEMLRMKNRSRPAKEKVKTRLATSLAVSPAVLLELANGKNKKDAEWAILQLTKMSLAGENIEGFTLE